MTMALAPVSKKMLWTGRILSALPSMLLLMSAVMKWMQPPAMVQGLGHYGWTASLAFKLGFVEFACTVLYWIPRTSILGAILLTGFLGGATATVVRVGDSFVMPVLMGVLVWGGLYLRDTRVRALIPFGWHAPTDLIAPL